MMNNDLFSKVSEPFKAFPAPVAKANKLCVNSLEKLVDLQMTTLRYYVDLGMAQLKEAAEVSSPEAMQAFLNSRVEVLNTLRQKVMDDAKALADLSAGFKTEFDSLAKESTAELTPKAA
jgi:phasin family protein